jgi:hypothetical protein
MRDYEIPPMRERLPTLPHDLSEYARQETGPDSWSASADTRPWDEVVEPVRIEAGPMIEVRKTDVPRVVAKLLEIATLEPRERAVISALDGRKSLGTILRAWALPEAEVIEVLCELFARGLVVFDAPTEAAAE